MCYLVPQAFKGTPYSAKQVQRLKGFMDQSLRGISFCSRALPRCLSFPARRRTLSQQREMRRRAFGWRRGAAVHPGEAGALAGHAGGHADAEPRKASRVPFPRRSDARENPMYAGDRSTTTTP